LLPSHHSPPFNDVVDVLHHHHRSPTMTIVIPPALSGPSQVVTLLGYGALLSESSSRLTFPDLSNFRHVRVKHHKRVFAHPHLFLIKEGLVDPISSLHLATLSAESSDDDSSFVAAAFDVVLTDEQRVDFVKREPEYDIVSTPYYDINCDDDGNYQPHGKGIICLASKDSNLSDIDYLHAISTKLKDKGGIWHWPRDSGLLPANIYLRHCLLAVQKAGGVAYSSFLEDTYLVDRKTTLKEYLDKHDDMVMASRPPPHLAARFGG